MTEPADAAPAAARREVGRRLAAARRGLGITQVELARRLTYSRSSVANAEIGRALPDRTFWHYADRVLGTGDAFVRAYDTYRELMRDRVRRQSPPVPVPATPPPATRPAPHPPAARPAPHPPAAAPLGVPVPAGSAAFAGAAGGAGGDAVGAGTVELVWGGYLVPTPRRSSPARGGPPGGAGGSSG
ncbi:helix-turn-helix transcriptional regulator [Polymorphospora rubra]|uniref:helix-turn-helix transcriptional regulator n=1 Tax=Polymorphospora rubra TaxID=338584 RepID=UPI0033F2C64D